MGLPPFQSVLDAHGPVVWRYLVAAVGSHDAADCYQETFVAALRAYPRLRPDSNVGGWLLTIAHRKVIDGWRASQRRAIPLGEVPDTVHHAPDEPYHDDDLWHRVRELPPKQRTAVVHRFVGDRSYAEIAEILGCSEDAARQNVHAGIKRLRRTAKVGINDG